MTASLERMLKRDRWIVALSLFLVFVFSSVWLLFGAGMEMTAVEMTRHSLMAMPATGSADWTPAYLVLMFFMWWIMMIAMMVPSATPVILLATALNRRSENANKPYGPAVAFLLGYLLAWGLFSAAAVSVQWWLDQSGMINAMLVSVKPVLSGVLLLIAGIWQFTPWKQACLRQCRSPVAFLTQRRKPQWTGALHMGMEHGIYCLGCCWFLMALLFVGGVMNLYWILGLAVYVFIEKYSANGERIARLCGGLLIGWGAVLLWEVFSGAGAMP